MTHGEEGRPLKVAIMQPYFLPYIGYFQLIASVDLFVVYDQIKYTKKGWINRNRMRVEGKESLFSLPLKKDSDQCWVCERELAPTFDPRALLARITAGYRNAPCFDQVMPLMKQVLLFEDPNLFRFLLNSLQRVCAHLGLSTPILVSSSLGEDPALKGQDKVISICRLLGATTYINAIGGMELYSSEVFAAQGIALKFIQSLPFEYPQSGPGFLPWLSILDVMMHQSPEALRARWDSGYRLI